MFSIYQFPKWIFSFISILFIILLPYSNKSFAQLNISQNTDGLNFFPVCAGNNVFWEFTDIQNIGPTGPKKSLKFFNGVETSTFIDGYSPSREVVGDGKFAVVKSGTNLFLFDGQNKTLITDKYSNAQMPVMKGREVIFLSPDDKSILYYNGDSLKTLEIIGIETSKKVLLGIQEDQLFFQGEGDLYIVDFKSANPVATKLNSKPNPSNAVFSGQSFLWLEYDGNDQEIYQWKNNKVVILTNNDDDDLLPAASLNNFAYLQKGALEGSTIMTGNGLPVLKTNAEITELFFVKETLVWTQIEESGKSDIYAYNNGSIEKLTSENSEFLSLLKSESFAVWKSVSGEEEVIKSFNGINVVDIFDNSVINLQPLGELSLGKDNLAWDTGYEPSIIYLFNLSGNNFSNFKLGDVHIDFCKSSETFFLPIIAKDSLPKGITGIDIVLEYDSSIISATDIGLVLLKDNPFLNFYVNTREVGICNIGIFTDGGDVPYISGIDTIISLQFLLNKKVFDSTLITAKEIVLSYESKSQNLNPAVPAKVELVKSQTGMLLVQNNPDILLSDGIEKFSEPTITKIFHFQKGNDEQEDRISDVYIDPLGIFNVPDKSKNSSLSIIRDIPGDFYNRDNCTDVMSVINSMDRNKALAIATSEIFNPSVFELIAADVNMDGRVTSGDATMISSRIVNARCEFPQLENYIIADQEYLPSEIYIPSRDWVFISEDNDMFNKTYDKDNVPFIPFDVDFSISDSIECNQQFYSIMLGDVESSLENKTKPFTNNADVAKVYFDFQKLVQSSAEELVIPVYVSSTKKFYGLDFSFIFQELKILGVYPEDSTKKHQQIQWNVSNINRLMVSVSNFEGVESDDVRLFIKVKLLNGSFNRDNISSIKPYYNGLPVDVEITDVITSNLVAMDYDFVVSPNPTQGNFMVTLNGSNSAYIEVVNSFGNTIKSINTNNGAMVYEFEMRDSPAGLYHINLYHATGVVTKKVIKF